MSILTCFALFCPMRARWVTVPMESGWKIKLIQSVSSTGAFEYDIYLLHHQPLREYTNMVLSVQCNYWCVTFS